jgi:hypothetical protein
MAAAKMPVGQGAAGPASQPFDFETLGLLTELTRRAMHQRDPNSWLKVALRKVLDVDDAASRKEPSRGR